MEEILDVYHRPFDPRFPVVAMDEQPIQLLQHKRQVIPARPAINGFDGHPERVDYEYERNGTACVFMLVAPFQNWRHVSVREQRTKWDWAEEIEQLVMRDFGSAEKVTIVLDNLNTHTKGSFYTRFKPDYCREILRRCEFVYTPVHGSWLNIAENELSDAERWEEIYAAYGIDLSDGTSFAYGIDYNFDNGSWETGHTYDVRFFIPSTDPSGDPDDPNATPEPATLLMFGLGLGVIPVARRFRKK